MFGWRWADSRGHSLAPPTIFWTTWTGATIVILLQDWHISVHHFDYDLLKAPTPHRNAVYLNAQQVVTSLTSIEIITISGMKPVSSDYSLSQISFPVCFILESCRRALRGCRGMRDMCMRCSRCLRPVLFHCFGIWVGTLIFQTLN